MAALVIYKGKPALAEEKEGRLELTLEGGERQRVRPKDVLLLHPGPASLDLKVPEGEERSEERRVGKECRSRWSPYH